MARQVACYKSSLSYQSDSHSDLSVMFRKVIYVNSQYVPHASYRQSNCLSAYFIMLRDVIFCKLVEMFQNLHLCTFNRIIARPIPPCIGKILTEILQSNVSRNKSECKTDNKRVQNFSQCVCVFLKAVLKNYFPFLS